MKKFILLSIFFVALGASKSFAEDNIASVPLVEVVSTEDLSVSINNPESEEYISEQSTPVQSSEDVASDDVVLQDNQNIIIEEPVVDPNSEEGIFLKKLKNCEAYASKETRPFDPTVPATKVVGWEGEKCSLNTISIMGTPLKCSFSKDKLSEIVQAYSDILSKETVDMNNNAIIQALSDEAICTPDYPEGDAYYSETVLTQMANKIAKCERIEIDNVNPLTATLTKRIIKGFEGNSCVYIESFPGNLNMICKYPAASLPELSSAYSEMVLELSETGKISADSKNPNIIDRLNNDLTLCKIENVIPEEEEQ